MHVSHLFRDPELRRVFARAEQDQGPAAALPAAPKPVLPNADARELVEA